MRAWTSLSAKFVDGPFGCFSGVRTRWCFSSPALTRPSIGYSVSDIQPTSQCRSCWGVPSPFATKTPRATSLGSWMTSSECLSAFVLPTSALPFPSRSHPGSCRGPPSLTLTHERGLVLTSPDPVRDFVFARRSQHHPLRVFTAATREDCDCVGPQLHLAHLCVARRDPCTHPCRQAVSAAGPVPHSPARGS